MRKFILFAFFYICILNPFFINAQVNKQDSLALVDLYNSTDGANWWPYDEYYNWDLSRSVINWKGVEVNGERVTKINLPRTMFSNSDAKLKGSIPSSIGNLTELTYLCLYGDLSGGGIPSSIGNLLKLDTLKLSRAITGEIPESIGNLINLKSLELEYNYFSGEIPSSIGNLTLLKRLNLPGYSLSGEIPSSIGNLVKLEYLNLNDNELNGEIPSSIGNLTFLQFLEISNNNLTGQIPESIGNLTNLIEFRSIQNSFTGGIPASIGNLSSIEKLTLNDNNFTSEIPASIGNLTTLTHLDLASNNLTSRIPNEFKNLVNIVRLLLGNNNLYGDVPVELANFSNLEILSLSHNNFNFTNLEPLALANLSKIGYESQEPLVLERATINGKTELEMKAGGKNTIYKWYYNNVEVAGANESKFTVSGDNEVRRYRCKATNSLLPYLTLTGIPPENDTKNCWQSGQLTFCIYDGEWEIENGTSKITTTKIVSINDFLFFDGTMTIDTLNLEVASNGEFYVDNIPLAGGSFGKYTLLKGKQNLTLMGSEGKIMDFVNTGLSKTASLFGAQLSIYDLQFFSRQDTFGMKVGCSAHIPWVSESCGTPGIYTPGTDLTLKNLEITNKGIMSLGFEAENIGLFKAGYCLNRITYEHDWKNNILIAGGDISLPFIADVSGGYKLENGKIDSVAWSVEGGDMLPTSPTGLGTLGVSGFYGHISGLNQPGEFDPVNLDIMFGGIFSDITSDKWYRITADGRTIWPKLFEFSGTGKLLKPMEELPYQIQGDIIAAYDVPNKVLKIDYNGSFLTVDEQYWLATGRGGYTVNHSNSETEVEGYFSGDITLPEISSYWPFNWFNSKTFGTYMNVFNENLKMVHGLLYYYPIPTETSDAMLVKMAFIINTEKEFYESGYIRFPEDSRVDIAVDVETKSGQIDNNVTEITVPENSEFGVIEIKSNTKASVSFISSPSGKIFSETSIEDRIIYSETEDKKTSFWSMLGPEPGDWHITLKNPQNNDLIISHFQLKSKDFNFSMNQSGDSINLEWDIAQVDSGQVINFMFDDDNSGFDGFKVVSADASLGSVSFTLDDNYPDCNYYLYAQLYNEMRVTEVYADDIIENHLSTLAPPENFSFAHNPQSGKIDFSWNPSPSEQVTGYILSIIDSSGKDSVYAVVSSENENISLFVENYEDKFATIESYNQDWKIGCAATLPSLVTAVNEINSIEEPSEKLKVYPNPTSGNCTIRYFVSESSECQIMVFDINGRRIAHPIVGFQTAGFHQVDFEYKDIPNGIYLIKFVNNQESFTVKSILSK